MVIGDISYIISRYDDDGKGYVTQTEFLNKLNITPHESSQSPSTRPSTKNIYSTASQNLLTKTGLHNLKYVSCLEWLMFHCICVNSTSYSVYVLDLVDHHYCHLKDSRITILSLCRKCLKLSIEDVRRSLVELDKNGDGHVIAMDLLALLQTHGFQIEDRQLLGLINKYCGVPLKH